MALSLRLLATVDDAADQHDLVARVVLDGEGESVVGLDLSLRALSQLALLTVLVLVVLFGLVPVLLLLRFGLLDLFLNALLGVWVGRANALFVDLDGSLMDQLIQMELLLLLLLLLLIADARKVGLVAVEGILDALLDQGLLGVQLVGSLELGQLHLRILLLLIAIVQQLFELLTVLNLLLLDLGQAVLALGHDDVHGQLLLLGRNTDHLDLTIFVVVEVALALDSLALLRLLATQGVETGLLGLLLLAELASPFGLHLERAHGHHLRVVGDGVLRNDVLDFVAGLGRNQLIDLLTASLRVCLERALLHLSAQALLDGLHELALSAGLLVHNDARRAIDLGFLLTAARLSGLLGLLHVVGPLEAANQSGVSLLTLLLSQTGTLSPLDLSLRVAFGTLLQSGQSQLDGGGRDDRVLVIALLLGLLVQLGGQLAVGLFELLQELVFRLALLLSLLSLLSSLLAVSAAVRALALGFLLVVVLVIVVLALAIPASGLLLLLAVVLVRIAVIVVAVIVVLLALRALEQLIETALAIERAARRSKAHQSNQNEETHLDSRLGRI